MDNSKEEKGMKEIKKPRHQFKLPQVINETDFKKLLDVTRQPHHRLAFKLGFLSGLRISEIVNLKPNDCDKERKLIYIRQGKGKKDRYTPLPKFISPKEINLLPIKCKVRALERVFKRHTLKALNREDLHFHNLRHSFATNLLNKKIPISDIQFWLGHSRLETTAIYLKVNPEQALKRYEELWI